jgi:Cyclopropane fatty acid synthase and related methyltransferases
MNRESYNKIAAQWDAARVTFHSHEQRYLEALLEGLPSSSSILDLGCGTGRPMAEFVLAHGHRVTGVDQSEALLSIARYRLPQADWIQSRIEDFAFDGCYDGAICWDSLFHIDRSYHRAILSSIHTCLAPGARLMVTVGGSANPAFTDTMFGQEFFYDSHPPEQVLSILSDLGFEFLISEFMDLPTSGRDKGRYAIVARKA